MRAWPNPTDLVGARFGRLVVLAVDERRSSGYVRLSCRCDCGVERSFRRNLLASNSVTSCGCRRDRASEKPARKPVVVDLSGRRFGRLLVIADSGGRDASRRRLWTCACDCGKSVVASSSLLTGGNTSSCGCRQRDGASERKAIDLAGRVFGWLTVVERSTSTDAAGYLRWKARCVCGCVAEVRGNALRTGEVVSCGCAAGAGVAVRPEKARIAGMERCRRRRAVKVGAGGEFTEEQVARLFTFQRGRCACCSSRLGEDFHRDHKNPLSRGGSNDILNIELLCPSCNQRKHAKDPIAWANENGRLL